MPKTEIRGNQGLALDRTGLEYKKWKNGAPFPVSMGICRGGSNFSFDLHWHDGPELTLVTAGQIEYMVNDKRYLMRPGDCVFANSGAMHAGRTDEGGCQYLVLSFLLDAMDNHPSGFFADRFFGGEMDPATVSSMFFLADERDNAVAERLLIIYDLFRKKEPYWELRVRGELCHLWAILSERSLQYSERNTESSASVARIKKAIRYMEENYAGKISLEGIAAACNLSKSEFCRCFKRITRQTPFEYLMHLRIRKSIKLLENDGVSVTEAALASGFSASSYYTEVFRRYMGCTPREYLRGRKESNG